MQEIFFIGGSPCSGKSSVALALSQYYGLSYYSVDDHLPDFMDVAAQNGCPICIKQKKMNQEQTWMRDPGVQCEEELAFYQEVFPYVLQALQALEVDRPIVAEGAVFLPALMEQLSVNWNHYYCITPEQDFQISHYIKREWVPLMIQKCSDPEQAFANWMERDALFAKEVEQQCLDRNYACYCNDGKLSLEEMIQRVTQHFCLYGRYVKQQLHLKDTSPSMSGIFSDICKGEVWLNQMDQPSLGVAYSYCVDGYGVAGHLDDTNRAEAQEFLSIVLEDIKEQGKSCFEFSAEEETLEKALLELFSNRKLEKELEYSYRLNRAALAQPKMDGEVHILAVDRIRLQQMREGKWENAALFLNRLTHSWNHDADFLHYSKGYIAVLGTRIVGVIFGSARYESLIAVDIEVEQEHRRKGIAGCLAEAFVNACVKEKLTVQWDRVESNEASGRLAKRLGFTLLRTRYIYWFPLDS